MPTLSACEGKWNVPICVLKRSRIWLDPCCFSSSVFQGKRQLVSESVQLKFSLLIIVLHRCLVTCCTFDGRARREVLRCGLTQAVDYARAAFALEPISCIRARCRLFTVYMVGQRPLRP
jgi:hypothetical protein